MADRPEMNQGRRGSTVLYAVFLAALLAVLGMGYMTAGVYSRQELTGMMRYGQAQAAAGSLHQSFCQAVNEGSSRAMNQIWDRFLRDCRETLADYAGEADPGEEEEDRGDADEWEEFLRGEMEGREYISRGEGKMDGMRAEILLRAFPYDGQAYVHTRVEAEGFTFCLGGEIRFDSEGGKTLVLPGPFEEEEGRICTTGERVYRYWAEMP